MRGLNMEYLYYYLPIIVMLLIQFIFAGQTLGTRIALLEGMSPRVFVVYRSAFATIVLAPFAYLSGRNSGSYSLNLRSFSLIFLTSLIGITMNQNLYFEGLYLASSSVASAICNLLPAITFVIAVLVGMEKVNIRSLRTIAKIVGTIICVSGAVCIALLKGPKLLNAENIPSKSILGLASESDENWLLGCLSLLGCIVAWSIFLILQVPAYASHPNYLSLSAWMCFMATLQSAAVTLFLEPNLNAWKINSVLQLGCSIYAGVMEIYVGSLIGAIGVIIGLYIVLWGKAEDVVDVQEKIEPKSMVNETEEAYSKTDLEEPFLHAESTSHH
ncbi:hypothetical protein P8452_68233 [Trifolium repens]|nr:hypothetical protein P8452_68233 [Trifolium repens]